MAVLAKGLSHNFCATLFQAKTVPCEIALTIGKKTSMMSQRKENEATVGNQKNMRKRPWLNSFGPLGLLSFEKETFSAGLPL